MKILIYFLIIVLWSINMEAKVKLPPLLSDNMVLQQKSNVRIWGKATPNSTVVVTPSCSISFFSHGNPFVFFLSF